MNIKNFIVYVLLFLCCHVNFTQAAEKSASVSLTVKAFKWSGIRLGNVNKEAVLTLNFSIDGNAKILLLDEEDYKKFPLQTLKPLFQSTTQDKLRFSIVAPKSSNYYLIVDNRENKKQRKYTLDIHASLETKNKPSSFAKKKIKHQKIDQNLSKLALTLKKAFVFGKLNIQLTKCGKINAYSHLNTVFLCIEYVKLLTLKNKDKSEVKKLLLFTLMHEIGHILLAQWNYPFSENEEIVDEFATVILIMLNQPGVAAAQADFFASFKTELEFEKKIKQDMRHPFSIQRARNIRRWLNNPSTAKKWQTLLVPNMQTAFLEVLQKKSSSWIDHELVEKELFRRHEGAVVVPR